MVDQAFHLRSISLPSRSHPAAVRVNEDLHKLRICTASSTTEAVYDGLRGLGDVYDDIDELLRLPGNQQSLSHPNQRKWVEEELELSLRLLDLSGAIRDNLSATMVHLQALQFSHRRKDCSNAKIKAQHRDSTSVRSINKAIANSLRSLQKQMERSGKRASCSAVGTVLVEAREISISILRSASSFLAEARMKPKASRWPFVTKTLHKKKVSSEVNEIENGEEPLADLCSNIQKLEDGLAYLFRRLLRNRVSLLNILSF